MPPLLQLTALSKSFEAVRALKQVCFDLKAGEVHALLGENGAGKSTLIKIISGACQPDEGDIQIDGQPVHHLTPTKARKLGIACIHQQPALFPDLSVAENIALRLETVAPFRRIDWPERRARAVQLLDQIGAEISPKTEVGELSMPEQQIVEIACALGASSRIVLMDEPTASLTRKEQHLLFAVVRRMRQSGIGIIYISHRLEEIFALAERVTVLRDGETVATNSVSDVNESILIRLMVGRELAPMNSSVAYSPGRSLLSLKNFGCAVSNVRDISLELHAGEILGLAGLVGAGRTELARAIFGITPADSGEMRMEGEPLHIHSPAEAICHGIAYVPEDRRRHGIILEMALAANITLASHRSIFPTKWLRLGAERGLAQQFIQDLGVRAPGPSVLASSLSGGNQQKVSVARWLATKPKLLLLDEPTQGVDVGAKHELHQLIRQMTKSGLGVLLISSDLPELLAMSDRIAVMRGGTLAAILPGGAEAHEVMAMALGQAGLAA